MPVDSSITPSYEELRQWLDDCAADGRPSAAILLAHRAAVRATLNIGALLEHIPPIYVASVALRYFRCLLISRVAALQPDRDFTHATVQILGDSSVDAIDDKYPEASVRLLRFQSVLDIAFLSTRKLDSGSLADAIFQTSEIFDSLAVARRYWQPLLADQRKLAFGNKLIEVTQSSVLLPEDSSETWQDVLTNLQNSLLHLDKSQTWQVWIDIFDQLLRGGSLFKRKVHNEQLLEWKIISGNAETGFWQQDALAVMTCSPSCPRL